MQEQSTATPLSPDDAAAVSEALTLIVDRAMEAFEARVESKPGFKGKSIVMDYARRAAVRAPQLLMSMAKKASPEKKLKAFVEGSNKFIPHLKAIFREEAVLAVLPPEVKTERILALVEKAGATEAAALLRQSMAIPPALPQPLKT